MGYSCSAAADHTCRQIMNQSGNTLSNCWTHKNGNIYFFEIGREQCDGAITGSVYKILPDGNCIKSGSVRIEGNGSVTKFSCLNEGMRKVAKQFLIKV